MIFIWNFRSTVLNSVTCNSTRLLTWQWGKWFYRMVVLLVCLFAFSSDPIPFPFPFRFPFPFPFSFPLPITFLFQISNCCPTSSQCHNDKGALPQIVCICFMIVLIFSCLQCKEIEIVCRLYQFQETLVGTQFYRVDKPTGFINYLTYFHK